MEKFLTIIALIGMLVFGFGLNTNHQANAAAFGAHVYTVPRAMRGTWYYRSHRNASPGIKASWKRIYKKIRITRHGITFTRRGRVGLKGHYTLMRIPNRRWSTRSMSRAERYAARHRWLGADGRGHSFAIRQNWLPEVENTNTGELSLHGRRLCFANVFTKDYYRR